MFPDQKTKEDRQKMLKELPREMHEAKLKELNNIDGVWYDGETIEEALERSRWCNTNIGFGARLSYATTLGFKPHSDGVWRDVEECEVCIERGSQYCNEHRTEMDDNSDDVL